MNAEKVGATFEPFPALPLSIHSLEAMKVQWFLRESIIDTLVAPLHVDTVGEVKVGRLCCIHYIHTVRRPYEEAAEE